MNKQEIPIEHSTRFITAPVHNSLVTCVGHDEKPNIISISLFGKAWGLPLKESDPPFGVYWVMIHPNRYSHKLIEESGEFVINIPVLDIVAQVFYCGVHSGRHVDKFSETKLTAIPAKYVRAPLIKECPINIECRVVEKIKPQYASYTIFFGKALAIHVEEGIWDGNRVNIDKYPIPLTVSARRTSETQFIAPGKIIFVGGKPVRE